jgi:recombination protein RecR
MHDDVLQELIHLFSKLPGIGPKSASRIVLFLLKNKEKLMYPLSRSLLASGKSLKKCKVCGNIGVKFPDKICNDPKRDKSVICVVEDIADLWAVEQSGSFKGLYHILGGSLSALDNITPDDLMIKELMQRAENNNIKEIILALNSTVNSQTTLHYIIDKLNATNVKITKIAQGMPFGAELNYVDEGTLTTAMKARKPI